MADSCMVNYVRSRLLLTEHNPAFPGYDERLWTALADADNLQVDNSIAIVRSAHLRFLKLLPTLPEDAWSRTLVHRTSGQVSTLDQLLRSYLDHSHMHLEQFHRLLAAAMQDSEQAGLPTAASFTDYEDFMTNDERAALVAKIAALPQQLEEAVRSLTPQQLTSRPLAGEWSVAQNVHHLADSHMNSFIRVKLMLTEENPMFKPYDQEAWAELPDATSSDIGESLDLLRGLHKRWVRLYAHLPEAAWSRTGTNPESGRTYTMEDILRTYAGHGEAHLDQIGRTLAAADSFDQAEAR